MDSFENIGYINTKHNMIGIRQINPKRQSKLNNKIKNIIVKKVMQKALDKSDLVIFISEAVKKYYWSHNSSCQIKQLMSEEYFSFCSAVINYLSKTPTCMV